MLQNWSNRYYSHHINIKYVSLTIKCIDYESIDFANLDVVSSFMVFNDFNYMFLSMYS